MMPRPSAVLKSFIFCWAMAPILAVSWEKCRNCSAGTYQDCHTGSLSVSTVVGKAHTVDAVVEGVGAAAEFRSLTYFTLHDSEEYGIATEFNGTLSLVEKVDTLLEWQLSNSRLTLLNFTAVFGESAIVDGPRGVAEIERCQGGAFSPDDLVFAFVEISPRNRVRFLTRSHSTTSWTNGNLTTFFSGTDGATDGSAVAAAVSNPTACVFHPDGLRLFVTEYTGSLRIITRSDTDVEWVDATASSGASLAGGNVLSLAINPDGAYIMFNFGALLSTITPSDQNSWESASKVDVIGTGTAGHVDGVASVAQFGGSIETFPFPSMYLMGIAISKDDLTVIVSDSGNYLIRRVSRASKEDLWSTATVITLAGNSTAGKAYTDAADPLSAEFSLLRSVNLVYDEHAALVADDRSDPVGVFKPGLRKIHNAFHFCEGCDGVEGMNYTNPGMSCNGTCNAGYFNKDQISCGACQAGTYSAESGLSSCLQCAAGTYSMNESSTSCSPCAAGTFSNVSGADNSSVCLPCPNLTVSQAASTQCGCRSGYTGMGSNAPAGEECKACEMGKYKEVPGSEACSNCTFGTYSATVAAANESVCISCPTGATTVSEASVNLTECVCNLGYTGQDAMPCNPCPQGAFKNITGTSSCLLCGIGKYNDKLAARTEDACTECTYGSSTLQAGAANYSMCVCQPSYFGMGGIAPCYDCPAGSIAANVRTENCTVCMDGKYAVSRTDCVLCEVGHFCADGLRSPCRSTCPSNHVLIGQCFQTGRPIDLPCYDVKNPCCWQSEFGCDCQEQYQKTTECPAEIINVDVRATGPLEFTIGWSQPNSSQELKELWGYTIVIYDTSDPYDFNAPRNESKKTLEGDYRPDKFNDVPPCRTWYKTIAGFNGSGLWESGQLSNLDVLDSGFGASSGSLTSPSPSGDNFEATYSVCPVSSNGMPISGNFTGLSHEICELKVNSTGEGYLSGGMAKVQHSFDPEATFKIEPRVQFSIEKKVSNESCSKLWCRPAFVLNATTADQFVSTNADFNPFPGLQKGHKYAVAVIARAGTQFGRVPLLDSETLGTVTLGRWAKTVALAPSMAPENVQASSCLAGNVKVSWLNPTDLGGGSSANITEYHVQVSSPVMVNRSNSTLGNMSNATDAAGKADDVVQTFVFTPSQIELIQGRFTASAHGMWENVRVAIRIAIKTAAGLGKWSEWITEDVPRRASSPPHAPSLMAYVTKDNGASVEIRWSIPFNTGLSPKKVESFGCPITSYTVKLQTMTLFEGLPVHTCGTNDGASPSSPCCYRWRTYNNLCGCGTFRTCTRMSISLTDKVLGIQIKDGQVLNVTISAQNDKGMGPESYLYAVIGTARDMWGRRAAHCSTNELSECRVNEETGMNAYNLTNETIGRQCRTSNLKEAWCNSYPGEVAHFGASMTEVDVDECSEGLDNCDEVASCSNTVGSFTCACNAGYHYIGSETISNYTCVDDDECLSRDKVCPENSTCVNLPGAAACNCGNGRYWDSMGVCSPCPPNTDSGPNATSVEQCLCAEGWSGPAGGPCADIDECIENITNTGPPDNETVIMTDHTCALSSKGGACTNTPGSFYCECAVGFWGDGVMCAKCPQNSNSSQGSNYQKDCNCTPGFDRRMTPCYGLQCINGSLPTPNTTAWEATRTLCPKP